MQKFIPASVLKKKYLVYGNFYTIKLENNEIIECRNILEIHKKNSNHKNIDAIFIMMNPGSSSPLEEFQNIVTPKTINKIKINLVKTKPDITQYQLMRIMRYFDWSFVRVLNLSDLRDPQSGRFVKYYKEIENRYLFKAHSLFDKKRKKELDTLIDENINIILAWGISEELNPLISRCLKSVRYVKNIIGLKKIQTKDKYYHPLPTLQKDKILWVDNMIREIEKNQ